MLNKKFFFAATSIIAGIACYFTPEAYLVIRNISIGFVASVVFIYYVAHRLQLTSSSVNEKLVNFYGNSYMFEDKAKRLQKGRELTEGYYDIVTDWYEAAWGQSFQLGGAQGFKGETLVERCRRRDYWFAYKSGIKEGQRWLDLGCGVGGPMRNISRFTGAAIVGVNVNKLQMERANKYIALAGLNSLCSITSCDFTKLEDAFAPESFDGAFALEALCHASDKVTCYKSIYKALKPGGTFSCFEWVLTDKYDENNVAHQYYKKSVEIFGGVADLCTVEEIMSSLVEAGFKVLETHDVSEDTHLFPETWFSKFDPSASIMNFPLSKMGIRVMQLFLRLSESLYIVPKGSAEAHRIICSGLEGTMLSGKHQVFTPSLFFKAQKV